MAFLSLQFARGFCGLRAPKSSRPLPLNQWVVKRGRGLEQPLDANWRRIKKMI